MLEATGAGAGLQSAALAEQNQLLHCEDPQMGLSPEPHLGAEES